MSTKTIYTSTISLPAYAGWVCQNCEQKNFTQATIIYRGQSSSPYHTFSSKKDDAKNEASQKALDGWKDNALNIITQPNSHPTEIRNYLIIHHPKCESCKKKAKWTKDTKYLIFTPLALMIAILSGLFALALMYNVWAWIIFASSLLLFFYGLYDEYHYKRMMKNLPEKYTPIIGSSNDELLGYAIKNGLTVLNIGEIIDSLEAGENRALASYIIKHRKIQEKTNDITTSSSKVKPIQSGKVLKNHMPNEIADRKIAQQNYCFCRKCGAKLIDNAMFCKKCGAKIL